MNERLKLGLIFVLVIFAGCTVDELKVSVVSPLVKVFPDTFPEYKASQILYFECAANEYEPAQFLLRSNTTLEGVTVDLSDLESEEGHKIYSRELSWNFVGFRFLDTNTPDGGRESDCGAHPEYIPEGELIRDAPCLVPDPLLEIRSIDLEANSTQPVWVTVYVPSGTPAGIYKGEARIKSPLGERVIPMEVKVYPFELTDERNMYMTNWFSTGNIANDHGVDIYSEEFWEILERYARNMAEHRQNVVRVPWRLIKIYQDNEDDWTFDYSRFDRFIETFIKAGVIGRIEISHIASRGDYEVFVSAPIGLHHVEVIDRKSGDTLSIAGEIGLPLLLNNLQKHLDNKGWLDKSMIHIADEPTYYNLDTWKGAARYADKYAPDLKTIDAIEATGFEGLLDIGVVQSTYLPMEFETYKKEFQDVHGTELWYYTCCKPYGHFPNRFLDYPLTDMRVLHWMNYWFDIKGYLHWALNRHRGAPFEPPKDYPPGDTHIIYPGKDGPMNSIRWEIQRESLEDFEYFKLLETKTNKIKEKLGPAADVIPSDFRSKEICGKVVKSFTDYTRDPEVFYTVKSLLASEIIEIDKQPLVLFTTTPDTNTTLKVGPAFVYVRGVVENQAEVKINGWNTEVKSDGSFFERIELLPNDNVIRLAVENNGNIKVMEREFKVY